MNQKTHFQFFTDSEMNIEEIIEQLEACNFRCEAGPLEKNVAFVALKEMLKPSEPRSPMTILERIGKWETTPLARLLFDLTHMGFNCKMDVYPHGCESGSMASVRIEKDSSLAGYFQGSTAGILRDRIVKWAAQNGLRNFLKEGHEQK